MNKEGRKVIKEALEDLEKAIKHLSELSYTFEALSEQEGQHMGSPNRYVKCRDTRPACMMRMLDGKCKILTSTEFKTKEGKVKKCPFYKLQNTPA